MMEFYKRFSFKPFGADSVSLELDELVADRLNEKLARWSEDMRKKHPSFSYRIVNAESPIVYNIKSDVGKEKITSILHVVYEIGQ